MSTTVTYPSADFPAQPSLTLNCPEGWESLSATGLPLAIAAAQVPGRFRPNIIALVSRLTLDQTLEGAIEELVAKLSAAPEYAEVGREQVEVGGFPGFRIEAAFAGSPAGTLMQAVRIAVVPRGPVQDLIQLTATCDAEQAQSLWPEIRSIQDSLRIVG